MIKKSKRYLSLMLASAILFSNMAGSIKVSAETRTEEIPILEAKSTEYEIYPAPQKISYQEGDFSFENGVNVIYESGIDSYTKSRLESEILKAHNISYEISTSNEIVDGKTNILVGIKDSGEAVVLIQISTK